MINEVVTVFFMADLAHASGIKVGNAAIKIDPRYFRPTEVETLLSNPSKVKTKLGWTTEITVQQMCEEMLVMD